MLLNKVTVFIGTGAIRGFEIVKMVGHKKVLFDAAKLFKGYSFLMNGNEKGFFCFEGNPGY